MIWNDQSSDTFFTTDWSQDFTEIVSSHSAPSSWDSFSNIHSLENDPPTSWSNNFQSNSSWSSSGTLKAWFAKLMRYSLYHCWSLISPSPNYEMSWNRNQRVVALYEKQPRSSGFLRLHHLFAAMPHGTGVIPHSGTRSRWLISRCWHGHRVGAAGWPVKTKSRPS